MRDDERGVDGACELLSSVPSHTVLTLCQTVTQNSAQCSQQDAVKEIILHSVDLESILRRKCMTRDILIKYLYGKGISISISAAKQELIQQILSLWNSDLESSNRITNTKTQEAAPASQTIPIETELQIMAKQFIGWFYPLLTECRLHEDNFWENSEVLLNLNSSNGECQSKLFSGVPQVLNAFTELVQAHRVVLAANFAGGFTAELDPHGLVLISCSGTVHQQASCMGVFQQTFALTADPYSQGDWRIKRSTLDVRVETASTKIQSAPAIESGH